MTRISGTAIWKHSMCRMLAFRASHTSSAADHLVFNSHSLLCQSQCDSTHRTHPDGWGVVAYRQSRIDCWRSEKPAFSNADFSAACQAAKSTTILAHVRLASKGGKTLENTHPFVFGRWAFAHNGTLNAVEHLRPQMLREIPPRLRNLIAGETDSELVFYWLLQRLTQTHAILGDRCISLARMRHTIADCLTELDKRNIASEKSTGSHRIAKLNILLTNGSVLLASRMRNTLFLLTRDAPASTNLPAKRAVCISSEPSLPTLKPSTMQSLSNQAIRDWQEIPDGTVLSVSSKLVIASSPIFTGNSS